MMRDVKKNKNEIIKNYLKDNNNVWEMQSDGTYKHLMQNGGCAQEKLIALYEEEDKSI